MLTSYYEHPFYLRQLYESPLGQHLDGFAAILHEQGYANITARHYINVVRDLGWWIKQKKLTLDRLSKSHLVAYQKSDIRQFWTKSGDAASLSLFWDYLEAHGLVSATTQKVKPSPIDILIAEFCAHLATERGLAPSTQEIYCEFASRFLRERFATSRLTLTKIDAEDVAKFMLQHIRKLSSCRAKLLATSLRSFFRFLIVRGMIEKNLALCVPPVPQWRLSSLPKYLEPGQVKALLRSCDRSTAVGRRDYAVLLLLTRLALRASEVICLSLEDIDWEKAVLVIRGKGNRTAKLPLPQDVGDAIAAYLKNGRPNVNACRSVFMRSCAPYRALSGRACLCNIIVSAAKRANLKLEKHGAHRLRHTVATQMLRSGASLQEIGDLLRHKKVETSAIYAKVDMKSLKSIARLWPRPETCQSRGGK